MNLITKSFSFIFLLLLTIVSCTVDDPAPDIRTAVPSDFDEMEGVSAVLADGFELDLWAPGPLLSNAVALTFDQHGAAYVSETSRRKSSKLDIRQHRDWMLVDLSLESVADAQAFLTEELATAKSDENRWLADHNNDGVRDYRDLAVESEYIRKVWDSDGDGRADRSQLFANDINQMMTGVAAGVMHYEDEIYVTAAPEVFKYADTNQDGKVDKRTSISTGFGIHIAYAGHDMSGLTVGHDGKIYWSIGDMGVNATGPDGRQWKYPHEGAVMRCNPDGSDFEVFAHGLRNPQELDFDAFGNLISVDNDGDHKGEHERYVHIIEGSDSGWRIHWQYGKYNLPHEAYKVWTDEMFHVPHFEGQAAFLLPPIALAYNGPAGLAYNPGTALGNQWKDYFFVSYFTANSANSKIQAFKLKPNGATFEVEEIVDILSGIVPTGITFAADGALYMNDWKDSYEKKPEGRIWKLDVIEDQRNIERKQVQALMVANFADKSIKELEELIGSDDKRIRLKAQFELVKRNEDQLLLKISKEGTSLFARLHAIWGVGQMARVDNKLLSEILALLTDADPHVRGQVAKIIGEAKYEQAFDTVLRMLDDEDPKVRFLAVESIGKIGNENAFDPLVRLLANLQSSNTHMRHAIVYAISRICEASKIASLANHKSSLVRLGGVVALRELKSPLVVRFLSDQDDLVVLEAARAINDDNSIPEALGELADLLNNSKSKNEALLRRAINANLRLARKENAINLINYSLNSNAPMLMRQDALWALGYWSGPMDIDRVDGSFRKLTGHVLAEAQEELVSKFSEFLESDLPIRNASVEAAGRLKCTEISAPIFDLFQAKNATVELRTVALNALGAMNASQLSSTIDTALDDEDQLVRQTAQGLLDKSELDETVVLDLLSKIIESNTVGEKQKAIGTISKFKSPAAERLLADLFTQVEAETLQSEISLDVLTAIDKSEFSSLKERKETYDKQRLGDKMLAYEFTKVGGDVKQGMRIFSRNETAQCMRCHLYNEEGGDVGPVLTKIASTLSTDELLESLIEPNKRIAPGYGVVQITKQDDSVIAGIVAQESEEELYLKVGEETLKYAKEDIKSMNNLPSGMFDMSASLDKMQIRDLMAFLKTLK